MAARSSDMDPPSPKEHGDTGFGLQQKHPEMSAPDSLANMSPAGDTSDGTGATTRADQQPSKAKSTPTREMPRDLTSIADDKRLPPSTTISSVERSDPSDKATDCTHSDAKSSRGEASIPSANELGSLDNSASSNLPHEKHPQGGRSISSGETSFASDKAKYLGFPGGHHSHDSTAFSMENNVQGDGKANGTSNLGSRKRKNAQSSFDGKMTESQHEQHTGKKPRSSTTSVRSTATEKAEIDPSIGASKAHESPKSSPRRKISPRPDRPNNTKGSPTTQKDTERANETPSQVRPQQDLPAYESPIDRKINLLEAIVGANGQADLCCETAPPANQPKLQLTECIAKLDLSALKPILQLFQKHKSDKSTLLTEEVLFLILASNDCAPALKKWKEEVFDDPDMQEALLFALQESPDAWSTEAEKLASYAMHYGGIKTGKIKSKHEKRDAMMGCAKFVRRLVHCMSFHIITQFLDKCLFPDMDRFLFQFGAGILLTAYHGLLHNEGGFFTKLLSSPFGMGITSEVRSLWAGHLGLAGTEKDVHQWHHLNPSINLQRAALSFGAAVRSKIKLKSTAYDKDLLVKDKLYASSNSLTEITEKFHEQADDYPDLLVAIGGQLAISVLPNEVPQAIENHKAMCTVKPTCSIKHKQAIPLQDNDAFSSILNQDGNARLSKLEVKHKHFSQSNGRIVPCRALVAEVGNPDPFTERKELILYKRYKAVATVVFVEGGTKNSSKAWWEQWSKVAEVLPGRGVLDCIAFYNANREHFQRE